MSSVASRADPATLDNFFRPRSVAIIGLSRRVIASPVSILATLKDFGYAGEIYVVNPSLAGASGRGRCAIHG